MAALKLITSRPIGSKSTWTTWPAVTNGGFHCHLCSSPVMAALKLIMSTPLQLTTSAIASKTT
eukprot:8613076-Karenia_brevis.AAC.1